MLQLVQIWRRKNWFGWSVVGVGVGVVGVVVVGEVCCCSGSKKNQFGTSTTSFLLLEILTHFSTEVLFSRCCCNTAST
jgi:hypothetical protein